MSAGASASPGGPPYEPPERPDFEPPHVRGPEADEHEQIDVPARRRRLATALSQLVATPDRRVRLYLLIVLVALLGFAIYAVDQLTPAHAPTARPFPTVSLRGLVHPLPSPGPRPADPLLTAVWGPNDPNVIMDLPELTFAFRAPDGWECTRSRIAGVRYLCRDERPNTGRNLPANRAEAIVQSDECRAPCGPAEYGDVLARLRSLPVDVSGLHRVDDRTLVADTIDPTDPNRRLYRMSRVYDSDADGRLDRHLWVQLAVNPSDQLDARKMLGDLYDATR